MNSNNLPEEIKDNYFLDVVDWGLSDLFNPEFHTYLDTIIDNATDYLLETHQISPELTRKENEKVTTENYLFLWNLTNNKIKYQFSFSFKFFSAFLAIISDEEYELIRRMILSFQTKELIKLIKIHPNYLQFLYS